MQKANANLFNEHGLWQTLDVLNSNKTQPGISFFRRVNAAPSVRQGLYSASREPMDACPFEWLVIRSSMP